jgi:hypothetical protein
MKSVLQLLIMLAVLNAVFHAGHAAMTYYQLKDATEQMLTFSSATSTAQLQNRILEKANEMDLPLQPEDLTVRREGARSTAVVSYTQPVELFPNYLYPMKFTYSVEAYALNAGPAGDSSN